MITSLRTIILMAARNLATCPRSPCKIPTETRWKIERFGKAQTYAGKMLEDERQGGSATGEYAENALIREKYFILSFKLVFFTNVSNNCKEQRKPLNYRLYKKIQRNFGGSF